MENKNKKIATLKTILGKDSEFEGNMKFIGTIMIEGTFIGNILGEGTIIVGLGGEVRANIHASDVAIYGKVYGQVLIASLSWLKFSDYFKHIKNFQFILNKKISGRFAPTNGFFKA